MNIWIALSTVLFAGALALADTGRAQPYRHEGGPHGGYERPAPVYRGMSPEPRYGPPPTWRYGAGRAPWPGYEAAPPPGYPGVVVRRPNSLGADWRLQQEEARSGVRGGIYAPLGRVISGIARRTPGRQLDAGIEYEGGRAVYRIRWITDRGRRIDFLADAATGAIIGER